MEANKSAEDWYCSKYVKPRPYNNLECPYPDFYKMLEEYGQLKVKEELLKIKEEIEKLDSHVYELEIKQIIEKHLKKL